MLEDKIIDVKQGETPAVSDQSAIDNSKIDDKASDEKTQEEQIKILEEKLAKAEEEKENYKKGLLAQKVKKISLSKDEDVQLEQSVKPVDSLPKIESEDEWQAIDRRVEQKINLQTKAQAKQNEQIALNQWLKDTPELTDDALREAVIAEYQDRNGKSIEGVRMDLDRAYKFYKLDHNIPFESHQTKEQEAQLASIPTGTNKSESSISGFNAEESKVIQQYDIEPSKFKAFKAAVLSGEMEVPGDVLKILTG